jgi:hypothetical protein
MIVGWVHGLGMFWRYHLASINIMMCIFGFNCVDSMYLILLGNAPPLTL